MSHQEPISMRDPKFVSVAAKVFPPPKNYLYSGPKNVSKTFRKNKGGILSKKSQLVRKGKEILFKKSKTRKHGGTTAQNVNKKHRKRLNKIFKPKRRPHGSLTASDLLRLNRSSNKFTKTMGRKSREGRREKKKVSKYLYT